MFSFSKILYIFSIGGIKHTLGIYKIIFFWNILLLWGDISESYNNEYINLWWLYWRLMEQWWKKRSKNKITTCEIKLWKRSNESLTMKICRCYVFPYANVINLLHTMRHSFTWMFAGCVSYFISSTVFLLADLFSEWVHIRWFNR